MYGGVPGPACSPASPCRAGCFRCWGYNISPPSLLSGPDSILFVICWMGRSSKCVESPGSGRIDNAWEAAVCLVVDINFFWTRAPMKSWLLNELRWVKKGDCGISLGLLASENKTAPNCLFLNHSERMKGNGIFQVKPVWLLGKLRIWTVLLVCTNLAFFFFSLSFFSFFFPHLSLCDWWRGGAGNGFFLISLPPYSKRGFPAVMAVKCF